MSKNIKIAKKNLLDNSTTDYDGSSVNEISVLMVLHAQWRKMNTLYVISWAKIKN